MATNEVTLSRPLKVSIIGAGLGGLTAAIALRKSGHNVQVFEASDKQTEIGAGITLQVNALRVLHQLGFHTANLQGVEFDTMVRLDARTGSGTLNSGGARSTTEDNGRARPIACHRSDFRNELERLATAEEGQGTPAQLHLGSKVLSCDPEVGSITLANGNTISADLVIGADGIHSTIRSTILGQAVQPLPCGISCFRFLLDASGVKDIPDLRWYTDDPHLHKGIVWTGFKSFRMIVIYPVRNRTLINFVGSFADEDQGKPDWAPSATRQEVLEKFHDAHSKFLRLLDLPIVTPILKWKLRTVPVLGNWIRGHAALLGDSAHGSVPFMGQGASMAIEDAGVLGVLLSLGTTKDEIPARLAAYETLRKERAEFVSKKSLDRALSNDVYYEPPSPETLARVMQHDAIQVAQQYVSAHFSGETGARKNI
ncbi:FAD/NAD(P)-binding domain-containing protein [Roridomyces roridus]|uniref:FAD/NAD(P)-binding domain-containing protein n=1 Tax=Roridomyces roridus TaxID=1738132 RepID=A0AAD7B3J7_9AGAR|nr:FAD/NAD(P)-binding domain-containing protein [Roridomyces roridus]